MQHDKVLNKESKSNNEIDELIENNQFLLFREMHKFAMELIINTNGDYDIQSEEGIYKMRLFIYSIESFAKAMTIKFECREYRSSFSLSYKQFYQQYKINYVTEIIISAQEGLTSILLNSERYDISTTTLLFGLNLTVELSNLIIKHYDLLSKNYDEFFDNFKTNKIIMQDALQQFDKKYVSYEEVRNILIII
jgi:hypothetical protein